MNQNVVKNLSNTKPMSEIRQRMEQNRREKGDAYCEACDRWWYGISNKRCEIHNPAKERKEK